jgi:hypothetical protein
MDVLGAGKWIHPHAFWGADNFLILSLEDGSRLIIDKRRACRRGA